jgi:hypothetical protein
MSGTWYCIVGEGEGTFNGFNWDGSSWVSNSSIISGLGDVGSNSVPNVFNMSGTWYLISGRSNYGLFGFNWNGSSWVSNSSIIEGLYAPDQYPNYDHLDANVIYMDGVYYCIIIPLNGWTIGGYGHRWNVSIWENYSAISTGLQIPSSPYEPTGSFFYGWSLT